MGRPLDRRWRVLDPSVRALMAQQESPTDPPAMVEHLVDELHHNMFQRPPTRDDLPIDVDMAASFCGATVTYLDAGPAGSVRHEGDRYHIQVNSTVSPGRVRFSVAHEVLHIPFLAATRDTSRTDHDLSELDWSDQEELLCDEGAAHLLMPASAVREILPVCPTIDDVHAVADECGTSLEASLRRTAQLCGLPASAVVLEHRLKPVERRALARAEREPQLFVDLAATPPSPRLRVAYAINFGLFIPRDKSVDDACPLADIESSGRVDFVGSTGLVRPAKPVVVSAESVPLWRGDELTQRVLALVVDADAWNAAAV